MSGSSSSWTQPGVDAVDFDIFDVGSWRSITRAPAVGVTASGTTNVSPKRWLKRIGDVAGDLDVLALVVADGHLVGVVEQDVGGLQRRVGEQPGRDELASRLADLSLNCVIRDSSPNDTVHSITHASWVCSGTWLCTNTVATSGSRPMANSIAASSIVRSPIDARLLGDGERVEVDDAVEGVVLVLAAATQFRSAPR